jgi:hypothetical protein
VNRPVPDGGGGSSNFSSIQFEGMQQLIAAMTTAGTTLQDTTQGFKTRASGCGVSCAAFSQIIEIGVWAEEAVPGLKRRLTLAQGAAAAVSPGLSGWTVDEPVSMTEAEANAKGEALAQKILDHNRTDGDFVKITDDALDELMSKYADDPDVLSAFYAKLGPQTQMMPSLLEGSGAQDTTQLEKLSKTLALAMNDPYPPQGFKDLTDLMKTSTGHEPDPTNWDRLALLQWGQFPPDFVADVVKANGLDKMSSEKDQIDWRASMTYPLGMDGDLRTMIFGALQNNPQGTRQAFDGLDMKNIVQNVYGDGSFNFDLQENFINAMKAGTGTNDETMGAHSDEAAKFAFEFIQASAAIKDVPDLWVTKEGLAAIAASYAPEFVAGSNAMDAQGHGSSLTIPDNVDLPPGIDPKFFLSNEDVYKFLHGFGDQDERFDPPHDYSVPFDDAVDGLYATSLKLALEKVEKDPESDAWLDVQHIYGNLAGLHLQAQLDVRGDQDADDQATKDLMAMIMTKGIGLIPGGAEASLVVKGGIKIFKFAATKAVKSWRETDPETTRKALATDADVQASFLTDYQLFNAMHDAGYPGTEDVPKQLLEDGHLISPDKIAKDPDLFKKYHDWVDTTDNGKVSGIDSMVDNGKGEFRGGLDEGQNSSTTFDW